MARIGPAEVRERYGVEPRQVPDFIALRGDPSDKLPGAKGVGAVTAASLLKRYPDLEAALADGKFPTQADDLRLCRRCRTWFPPGARPPNSRGSGSSGPCPSGWSSWQKRRADRGTSPNRRRYASVAVLLRGDAPGAA